MADSATDDLLAVLEARGFLHQCTDREGLAALFAAGPTAAYVGYDATADSLHAGSLVTIMALRWLQKAGHRPIVLLGGGTSRIGDPSGKDETRRILSDEQIAANARSLGAVFARYLDFAPGGSAVMRNNADWLDALAYIPFLREVGPHFTVNRMLSFESVRSRLEREQPLTFLEFNYMILQAWDFLRLAEDEGCRLQLGGADQWGNIVCGIELSRRLGGPQLYGLTTPLVTAEDGAKMGKTAEGAVWLNPERLPANAFWQYWRNTSDADVGRFLRLFTELPLDEIARLEALEGSEINEAKIVLATEATALCRGAEAAAEARETARRVFEEGELGAGLAEHELTRAALEQTGEGGTGLPLAVVLRDAGLVGSNAEARRAIQGGGVRLNGEKESDPRRRLIATDFGPDGTLQLSLGQKQRVLLKLAS